MAGSAVHENPEDLVRLVVPELAGRPARLLGAGQFSDALLVEDQVVRIPKSELAVQGLRREVGFLYEARRVLRAGVPQVLRSELGRPIGRAFVVHRLVPGDLLSREWLDEMSEEELGAVALSVAHFLHSLHALAPDRTGGVFERIDLVSWWSELVASVEAEVVPHLDRRARIRIGADLGLQPEASDAAQLVVCHGDLGGNLLWGPQGLGVIDFASSSVCHPAMDLASLLVLGDRFHHAILEADPSLAVFVETARHIRLSFVAQDLLWSVRQDDVARFEAIEAAL